MQFYENISPDQLCSLNMESSYHRLSFEDTDYGQVLLNNIKGLALDKKHLVKDRVQNFMKVLFLGLKDRVKGTFKRAWITFA